MMVWHCLFVVLVSSSQDVANAKIHFFKLAHIEFPLPSIKRRTREVFFFFACWNATAPVKELKIADKIRSRDQTNQTMPFE